MDAIHKANQAHNDQHNLIRDEVAKALHGKGNHAAAVRARKLLQEQKKTLQTLREELKNVKRVK